MLGSPRTLVSMRMAALLAATRLFVLFHQNLRPDDRAADAGASLEELDRAVRVHVVVDEAGEKALGHFFLEVFVECVG